MTRMLPRLILASLLCTLGAACHDQEGEPSRPGPSAPVFPVTAGDAGHVPGAPLAEPTTPPAQGQDAATGAPGQGGAPAPPDQLPCDVASFLRTRCLGCHGTPPLTGIPMSLATYADLAMPSPAFPGQTYAQRGRTRIQMGNMPPGGGLTPAEVQLFSDWVEAGAPPGTCGAGQLDAGSGGGPPDAPPALDAATQDAGASMEAGPRDAALDAGPDDGGNASSADASAGSCQSGQQWDAGTRGSALMTPGQPCLGCHAGSDSYFSFAGTLFAAAHEPDDCFGAVANGAEIVILSASGQRLTLTPNAAGNFIANTNLPGPYTVEIRYQGRTRKKIEPQTSGDCNSCHSQQGANGAAGRITLP